jgi:hypothetical protein
MDTIRMNQCYAGNCSIVDKELNAYTTRFFYLLKDYNELFWDEFTNNSKLSIIA